MILTCPACQTQYVLPENALSAKGRTVKCANCSYSWRQAPITVTEIDLSQPAPFENLIPEPVADNVTATDMAQQLRWQQAVPTDVEHIQIIDKKKIIIQTALWLGLFFLLSWIALGNSRMIIVRKWPATALLYETFGFPEPAAGAGLKFGDDTAADLEPQAVPSRLHVSGRFTNTRSNALFLPILQARAFNAKGQWLKDWSIPLGTAAYMSGRQSLAFDYSLPQVPDEAYSLTFRFTDE